MTTHDEHEHDEHAEHGADDLLMRSADPASSLAPLPARQLADLTETTMSTAPRTPARTAPGRSAAAPARRRSRRLLAGAAGGVLVAAAVVGVLVATGPGAGGRVTTLTAPPAGGPGAMCAVPTAEVLATSTTAFRGTVVAVDGGTATLRVDDVFAGDPGDAVEVPQGDPDDQVDGAAPVFTEGGAWLVAASAGVVSSCGLTGPDSPELAALYDQAF
ncbi:hypothetical protein F1C15_11005 [Frigoribacterium sp. NBH87]|uniref:hypothetical protein n=1 Tax=Frigoribacterium sp. NBH87 TaxID=2596916 RepID=UPI0016297098|nr:hypothetical protein [Frigoribacterium sp. NBH87]QNE44266.1 hypothetical protein F1C15_11005 [Frigoribacterium sp. NBH87]